MRSTSAGSRPRARKVLPSDVEGRLVCIRHDPLLSPLDLVAHELIERQFRLLRIFEGDAPKCPGPWVERGVPELLRVHLAEALVPRDRGLSAALSIVGALIRVCGGNVSLLLGLLSGTTTGPGRRLIPVGAGLLDVQDLAPQRQDRLCPPVAAALRAAAGGRALHDEEFAFLGVALRAIGELPWQRKSVEGALALDEIACLARRLSRAKSGEA